MQKISLLTMSAGNPEALRRTLDSFIGVVDEVIFGDLIIFPEDRQIIRDYANKYKMTMVVFPFNYIFKNGFSAVLNVLAHHAKNNWCCYMNCSEIIDGEHRILEIMDYFEKYDFNCYPFNHATDPHSWIRTYKKADLYWSGLIHEELSGVRRPASHYLFQMADTPKDMGNLFKAKVYDFVKECVYFNNYRRIVDHPETLGATSPGWVEFARANYQSFVDRMDNKGDFCKAFETSNFEMLNDYIKNEDNFKNEKMESSLLIEYQNDKKFLL